MAATKLTAGVPASMASTSKGIACSRQIEQKPEQRREQRQRHAGGEPMGEALDRGDERQGQWPGDEHVERAILVIVVEDAVGGEKRGEQERHPQLAGRDAGEKIEVGPKPERRDGDDDEIEAERRADGAAFAKGEPHVALEEGERRAHETRSLPSASLCANFVLSGVWLATKAMPPAAR